MVTSDLAADIGRALATDGYIVLPGLVDRQRVQEFAVSLLAEYERSDKFVGGGTFSGHLNCFPGASSRFFLEEIEANGVADAIRALRPGLDNSVRATLNFNLPNSVAQHYHMDGLYIEDFVICNIGVVDTDLHNGAIDLLPGTQQRFYNYWEYAVRRLWRRSTRVPMRAGDVLIRRSTVWHRGMPNKSAVPRPMMSLTFGESSAPAGDPFAVHEGKMHFYPNWFNPTRLGRLRERVFVAAPVSYAAFRFAKSLTGKRGYTSY